MDKIFYIEKIEKKVPIILSSFLDLPNGLFPPKKNDNGGGGGRGRLRFGGGGGGFGRGVVVVVVVTGIGVKFFCLLK